MVKCYQMELVQTLFQIAPKAISQKEQQAMQVEIQALQVRQAIVKVQPFMDQFTSRLFVIDSLLRLVINLKRPNCLTKNWCTANGRQVNSNVVPSHTNIRVLSCNGN